MSVSFNKGSTIVSLEEHLFHEMTNRIYNKSHQEASQRFHCNIQWEKIKTKKRELDQLIQSEKTNN